MNIRIFNVCLLLGWLMATGGLMMRDLGLGIACGGLSLVMLTLYVARIGGLFVRKED
jgi:hypothetical protein